eukprot:3329684-Pleurochrysis_carterae.AAC.1
MLVSSRAAAALCFSGREMSEAEPDVHGAGHLRLNFYHVLVSARADTDSQPEVLKIASPLRVVSLALASALLSACRMSSEQANIAY